MLLLIGMNILHHGSLTRTTVLWELSPASSDLVCGILGLRSLPRPSCAASETVIYQPLSLYSMVVYIRYNLSLFSRRIVFLPFTKNPLPCHTVVAYFLIFVVVYSKLLFLRLQLYKETTLDHGGCEIQFINQLVIIYKLLAKLLL